MSRSHSDRDYEETASEEQQDQEDGESILEGIDEEGIGEELRAEEEEEEDIHQRNHIGMVVLIVGMMIGILLMALFLLFKKNAYYYWYQWFKLNLWNKPYHTDFS